MDSRQACTKTVRRPCADCCAVSLQPCRRGVPTAARRAVSHEGIAKTQCRPLCPKPAALSEGCPDGGEGARLAEYEAEVRQFGDVTKQHKADNEQARTKLRLPCRRVTRPCTRAPSQVHSPCGAVLKAAQFGSG